MDLEATPANISVFDWQQLQSELAALRKRVEDLEEFNRTLILQGEACDAMANEFEK